MHVVDPRRGLSLSRIIAVLAVIPHRRVPKAVMLHVSRELVIKHRVRHFIRFTLEAPPVLPRLFDEDLRDVLRRLEDLGTVLWRRLRGRRRGVSRVLWVPLQAVEGEGAAFDSAHECVVPITVVGRRDHFVEVAEHRVRHERLGAHPEPMLVVRNRLRREDSAKRRRVGEEPTLGGGAVVGEDHVEVRTDSIEAFLQDMPPRRDVRHELEPRAHPKDGIAAPVHRIRVERELVDEVERLDRARVEVVPVPAGEEEPVCSRHDRLDLRRARVVRNRGDQSPRPKKPIDVRPRQLIARPPARWVVRVASVSVDRNRWA